MRLVSHQLFPDGHINDKEKTRYSIDRRPPTAPVSSILIFAIKKGGNYEHFATGVSPRHLLAAAGFFYCLSGMLFLHNLYYQTQTIFGIGTPSAPRTVHPSARYASCFDTISVKSYDYRFVICRRFQ